MPPGRLFADIASMATAQVVVKLVNIAVSIAVVRYLGAQELGRYAYILAFAYPFGALADCGLTTLAVREVRQHPDRQGEILALLRHAALFLAGLGGTAMVGFAWLTRQDAALTAGIGLVGLSTLLSATAAPALATLTAREDFQLLSWQQVAVSVAGAVATMAVLIGGGGALSLLAAAAMVSVMMVLLVRRLAGPAAPVPPITRTAVWSMLGHALPFGAMMIGFALYYRIDMVMLEWIRDTREVGIYAAAYRFLDAVIVLVASLGGPLYPRLSTMAGMNDPGVRDVLEHTWKPMLALGLPFALGGSWLAQPLILALFGSSYADAAPVLEILIWGSLPLCLVSIPNHALIAGRRVTALAALYGCGAVANVAANLVLIPRMGSRGAAIATVLCEWLIFAVVVQLIRRTFRVTVSLAGVWQPLLAGAGMAAALWTLQGRGLPIELGAGVAMYAGGLWALGYWRSADMLEVRRLLAR